MAAVDKIYTTKDKRNEFYAWCTENKPDALRYFYDWLWDENDGMDHPITNFPEKVDMWMLDNCPIGWVVEYIKDQYGR